MSEDKSNLVDNSYNGAYDTAYTTPSYSVQGGGQEMFSNGPTTMPTTVRIESVVTSNEMYRQADQMPENYVTHNIIVLIFCSLIFGIIGLVKGNQVSALYASGNYVAAQAASNSARMFYKIGLAVGCFSKAFLIGYFIMYLAF